MRFMMLMIPKGYETAAPGTLPDAAYYVRAPHPDSLDSRYRLTGWVSQAQIIGRAHALF